jgi:Mn2+/Fe2+ NRAMP family transporter
VIGAATVLLPNVPLIKVAVFSQVLNGMLLPIVLVVILLLVSNSEIMGQYKNSRLYSIVTWVITGLITALTVYMLYTQLRPT